VVFFFPPVILFIDRVREEFGWVSKRGRSDLEVIGATEYTALQLLLLLLLITIIIIIIYVNCSGFQSRCGCRACIMSHGLDTHVREVAPPPPHRAIFFRTNCIQLSSIRLPNHRQRYREIKNKYRGGGEG